MESIHQKIAQLECRTTSLEQLIIAQAERIISVMTGMGTTTSVPQADNTSHSSAAGEEDERPSGGTLSNRSVQKSIDAFVSRKSNVDITSDFRNDWVTSPVEIRSAFYLWYSKKPFLNRTKKGGILHHEFVTRIARVVGFMKLFLDKDTLSLMHAHLYF
jgi:hypothetical protein